MRNLVLVVILLVIAISPAGAVEEDKVKHGSISMAFGAMANSSLEQAFPKFSRSGRWVAGTTLAMIPGVAKEFVDVRFDQADLAADLLGSVIGVLLMDLTGGRVWFQASEDKFLVGLRFGGIDGPLRPSSAERLSLSEPIVAFD